MTSQDKDKILQDNQSIMDEMKAARHRPILLGLGGSYAYGTNVEGSDVDVRGIYLNTAEELLGMDADIEQHEGCEDTVIYSLKKACKLLVSCNPAMIEIIHCRRSDYLYLSPEGELLIDNANLFLSKRAIKTFGGYARSQLNRLINRSGRSRNLILENEERSFEKSFLSLARRYKSTIYDPNVYQDGSNLFLSFAVKDMPITEVAALLNEFNSIDRGYRKSVRNDKAAAHNKLSKHMMHLIRLYMMGIELMENHEVHTYREGSDHTLLMSIRNGDYLKEDGLTPTTEFEQLVEFYSNRYEHACKSTTLSDEPDMGKINELMIRLNKNVLEEISINE